MRSFEAGRSPKKFLVEAALERLAGHARNCRLCPRECGVDRQAGELGYCGAGRSPRISHALLHLGEEPVLSGVSDCGRDRDGRPGRRRGSGTLFFSGCHLRCVYCQNHQISQEGAGYDLTEEALARSMLDLEARGAVNINLVSPSHMLLPILAALRIALDKGLSLPIVYNCSGYESERVLRSLEGIVDVYLPDLKYTSPLLAERLSGAPDYFEKAKAALIEMYCQQPVLKIGSDGHALRGMIVRHLVLPGQVSDSLRVLGWLGRQLQPSVGISIMSQFIPCFNAPQDLRRTLAAREYRRVLERAEQAGFDFLFVQPESFVRGEHRNPDFSREKPFDWRDRR
jgi:putative pyruvate formate lyase activating enzyme